MRETVPIVDVKIPGRRWPFFIRYKTIQVFGRDKVASVSDKGNPFDASDEIKSIPCTPRSHAFIERLIGTIRREYLDQTLFWNQGDLELKLDSYKVYYNRYLCHTGLAGITPAQRGGAPPHPIANLASYRWRKHCNGLFQTPPPLELYFATHRWRTPY
jgi:hypothetical protein